MELTIWEDKIRHFGKPISFTKYFLSETRVFEEKGFIVRKKTQILLYNIRDVSVKQNIYQKIWNTGDITILSSDIDSPEFIIKNIKDPDDVAELIYDYSEKQKNKMRIGRIEINDI